MQNKDSKANKKNSEIIDSLTEQHTHQRNQTVLVKQKTSNLSESRVNQQIAKQQQLAKHFTVTEQLPMAKRSDMIKHQSDISSRLCVDSSQPKTQQASKTYQSKLTHDPSKQDLVPQSYIEGNLIVSQDSQHLLSSHIPQGVDKQPMNPRQNENLESFRFDQVQDRFDPGNEYNRDQNKKNSGLWQFD